MRDETNPRQDEGKTVHKTITRNKRKEEILNNRIESNQRIPKQCMHRTR